MTSLDLGLQQYGDERGRQFLDRLVERTKALPGVRSATLAVHVPFDYGIQISEVAIDGEIPGSKDGYVVDLLQHRRPRFLRDGRGAAPARPGSGAERRPALAQGGGGERDHGREALARGKTRSASGSGSAGTASGSKWSGSRRTGST